MPLDIWAAWPTVSLERSLPMVKKWQERGYKVAVLINPPLKMVYIGEDFMVCMKEWRGFPAAANSLCRALTGEQFHADIVVVVGDDVHPEPVQTAQEIGAGFLERFPDLYGVMQPIGDKFVWTDRCAVSPWIGRGFIEKAYQGNGPFCEEYFHYFSDQELQEHALQLGCFQQREDITQFHDHWQRRPEHKRPKHLMEALQKHKADKRLFAQRQVKGFPVC